MTVRAGAAAPVAIDFVGLRSFNDIVQISYPDRAQAYALIVAPSSDWENYRYQAGAYLIYKMLKDNGMDDDHIVLVSEDDIARHPNNPTPGRILPPKGDGNLYEGVTVDYKPSEIGLSKLSDILIQMLAKEDNLFVYWRARPLRKARSGSGRRFPLPKRRTFSANYLSGSSFSYRKPITPGLSARLSKSGVSRGCSASQLPTGRPRKVACGPMPAEKCLSPTALRIRFTTRSLPRRI